MTIGKDGSRHAGRTREINQYEPRLRVEEIPLPSFSRHQEPWAITTGSRVPQTSNFVRLDDLS